jgi:hypothetical protein
MAEQRLEYMDLCKIMAIYMVTFAHCAQQLSGETFPNLLISKDSFISINMAIFMIISGFFINMDKMRTVRTKDYVVSKAKRLLFPMIGWYAVMCFVLFLEPSFTYCWTIYWYLGSLFVCSSLIKLLTHVTSNTKAVCLMSVLLLMLAPTIIFERCCYMIPFLWVGYGLRYVMDSITKTVVAILFVAYAVMYYFWNVGYSVYVVPFHFWDADSQMFVALLFRFTIGVVGGVCFIGLLKHLTVCRTFGWLRQFAKYGRYTLAFYTISFVLNAMLVRVMWHTNWYVSEPGWLDLLSFIVTTLMMVLIYYMQKLLEKNRLTRLIFLGEK